MIEQLSQTWWLIALSITAGVFGQTVIKLGVSQPSAGGADEGALALIMTIVQSPLILSGLMLYGIGALSWIAVLARMDLSYAYPFLALNFVLVTLVSALFLGETVPFTRWVGVMILIGGIVVVARSV